MPSPHRSQKKRVDHHRLPWRKRHPVMFPLFLAIASTLIGAGILGIVHLATGSGNEVAANVAAQRVASCVRQHHMTLANEGPLKPSAGTTSEFARINNGSFVSFDPIYGKGHIPVSLFKSCSWPAPDGSDATGYSQISVSTVPGSRRWPGMTSPYAFADVLDTSCKNVTAFYAGGHTGDSFSATVHVRAGGVSIAGPHFNAGPAPGPDGKVPKAFASWAKTLDYFFVPNTGESVVLHGGYARILKVTCEP
jgi:hypothetical protein